MYLANNIRHLRTLHKLTQEQLAQQLGLSARTISTYEQGSEPRLETLLKLSKAFGIALADLLETDLQAQALQESRTLAEQQDFLSGQQLRVLSITVDKQNEEHIELVAQKAVAGYTSGYADPEFLRELPYFHLPFLSRSRTYRAFEIEGDSMAPLPSGCIVVGELVDDWRTLPEETVCIVVGEEGIVLKMVCNRIKERGTFLLKSSNPAYPHYELPVTQVRELWRYTAHISRQFPRYTLPTSLAHSIDSLKDQLFEAGR